jgi:hypothetical protein
VVAVVSLDPVELELQVTGIRSGQTGPQTGQRPHAEYLDRVISQASDHVEVGVEPNLRAGGMRFEPVFRAEQALLLAIPECEGHAAAEGRTAFQCLGNLQQTRHSAGVVIGSVMDLTKRAMTVRAIPEPDMVEVGPDDDPLVLEYGIAPHQQPEDILIAGPERLSVVVFRADRLEFQAAEFVREIGRDRLAPSCARFAALESVTGQEGGVGLKFRDGNGGFVYRRRLITIVSTGCRVTYETEKKRNEESAASSKRVFPQSISRLLSPAGVCWHAALTNHPARMGRGKPEVVWRVRSIGKWRLLSLQPRLMAVTLQGQAQARYRKLPSRLTTEG